LMVFVTQLTAILQAGSQVTCHSFLNLHICFNRVSRLCTSLLRSESVSLLVDAYRGSKVARHFISFF
jgi:hypothetical protein